MLILNFNFELYMLLPGCIVDEGVTYLPDPVEGGLSIPSQFESLNLFMIRTNSVLGMVFVNSFIAWDTSIVETHITQTRATRDHCYCRTCGLSTTVVHKLCSVWFDHSNWVLAYIVLVEIFRNKICLLKHLHWSNSYSTLGLNYWLLLSRLYVK